MSTLMTTLREGIRYRGRTGHWSWIAHRVSGLAILSFLVVHVWDTANVTYAPEIYAWSIEVFKHPLFGAGEIAVMAAVLYHAFNGIRITVLDFKPEWWQYQRQSALAVWILFLVVFVPIGIMMVNSTITHCGETNCWTFPPFPSS